MSSKQLPAFPASKIKEIITQDPDLKDIPKKGIDMLRVAAEEFARYTFKKINEESKKKGKAKMTSQHFVAAINNDPALKAILGQFIVTEEQQNQPHQEEQVEENEAANEQEENEPEAEEKEEEKQPEEEANENEEKDSGEEDPQRSEQPSVEQSEQVSDLEDDM
ncbi:hypothetical protein TVAG_333630 [Trichomonas vaginalis G3]|uniref:Uncharacterized protein n=1 Tax=Trichomonas vaginalis (strain ATCC PRA-98 / G3) TaxID=412133 RepID=A2F8R9_TRIV3|nr:histone, subunit A domain-containing protein [Trichomonas vaginalis G3]EAX98699.1 hypothetical protein TVAG_333630 [Trichomonas vaginalis G3]KAI5492980.1 histone, subunit A domain-containing protein [Trichomonas vaginalis G3]|eukprot:XP_001311629.1 hypothetical protein [Trichomonas vaginalis G3]